MTDTAVSAAPPATDGIPGDEVTIVLVDDHALVRQGLRAVLEREPDLRVVGEASGVDEAVAVVTTARPGIVLLDLKLSTSSDSEGLAVCHRLYADCPHAAVLVLTTYLDDRLVVEAVQAGARGYVIKDVDTTELTRAIRAVSRGESAFDSRSASAMIRSVNAQRSGSGHLSERELEVLRLLAHGMSNRVIGKELFISETTVKFHIGKIMRKLEVSRRAEAVFAASKAGLI